MKHSVTVLQMKLVEDVNSRRCNHCKGLFKLEDLVKRKDSKLGRMRRCKDCYKEVRKESDRKYNMANKDKVKETHRKWRMKNKDRIKAYYLAHKEKLDERNRKWRRKNKKRKKELGRKYRKANPDKVNANNAKRRAAKLQATPHWLNKTHKEQIEFLYALSTAKTKVTGIKHHVDHIVPLINNKVCGLHVPWNLRVITAEENLKKHNRITKGIINE